MHIAQLLDPLALAPRIEIVEAALPGMGLFTPELGLLRIGGSAAVKISLRLDLRIPTLSQTARKDGAPAGGCEHQRQDLIALDLGMPSLPRRTREGWGNRRRKGDLRR
jgi:hypothetical protein